MNLPPPIPDPSAPPTRAPQQARKPSYLPVICGALLAFAVFWGLSRVVPLVWLFVVAVVPLCLFAVWVMLQIQSFYRRCNGVIGSRADLDEALKLIDWNMKGAYVMMIVFYPLMALALLHGETLVLPLSSLFLVPFALWSTNIEKKFKAMSSPQLDLSQGFADALRQMKAPQFGLKS
jgi:hypothetical protein